MKKYLYRLTIYSSDSQDIVSLLVPVLYCDNIRIMNSSSDDVMMEDILLASKLTPDEMNKEFNNIKITDSTEYILQVVNGISGTIYNDKVLKFISKYHG